MSYVFKPILLMSHSLIEQKVTYVSGSILINEIKALQNSKGKIIHSSHFDKTFSIVINSLMFNNTVILLLKVSLF